MTTVFGPDDTDLAEENLRFHLNAGVDLVLAAVGDEQVGKTLRSFGDRVQLERPEGSEAELRTRLARQAVTEHGADWVISGGAREFWWPRGEDLKEVLAPIPERYTIVQGLRRDFVPAGGDHPSEEEAVEGADVVVISDSAMFAREASRERVLGHDAHAHLVGYEDNVGGQRE